MKFIINKRKEIDNEKTILNGKKNNFYYVYCFIIYVYLTMFIVYPLLFHDLRL